MPPAFWQSSLVIMLAPFPLQLFWPLQLLVDVLQLLCPLQAFAPWHCTVVEASLAEVALTGAIVNIAAAPIANAVAVRFNLVITIPFSGYKRLLALTSVVSKIYNCQGFRLITKLPPYIFCTN